jgi:hypothetical protein
VTAREQLHQLVDRLDDDQAVRALALLEPLAELELVVAGARRSSSLYDNHSSHPSHELLSHESMLVHEGSDTLQVTRCSGRHRRW